MYFVFYDFWDVVVFWEENVVIVVLVKVDGFVYCSVGSVMVIFVEGWIVGFIILGCIEVDIVLYV